MNYEVNLNTYGAVLGKTREQTEGSRLQYRANGKKNMITVEKINERILKMIVKIHKV